VKRAVKKSERGYPKTKTAKNFYTREPRTTNRGQIGTGGTKKRANKETSFKRQGQRTASQGGGVEKPLKLRERKQKEKSEVQEGVLGRAGTKGTVRRKKGGHKESGGTK